MRPLPTWTCTCLAAASLAMLAGGASGANILGVFWFVAPSHFTMFGRLFRELAARGHNVTVLSHFPLKDPLPNYTDINIAGSMLTYADNVTMELVLDIQGMTGMWSDWQQVLAMCFDAHQHPEVRRLAHSRDHYDLVVAEVFYADCLAALAHKFGAPLVGIISSMAMPWAHDRMGNPDNPAYMDSINFASSAPFTFWQRLQNTCWYVFMRFGNWWISERVVDPLASDLFGEDFPPTSELVRNTSLVLVNSHWSTGGPFPRVPGVVEVGGLHVGQPAPLPQELGAWLDGSPQGVVYFSLGTMVRPDTFSPHKLRAVLDVFSRLQQRVLWRADPDRLPELPPNVLARRWLPQNDVLNHPNVRVFITHSGLMGTQEAVAAGVPMLCMPMFADQFLNADRVVAAGHGLKLLYQDLSRESLSDALHQLLDDTRYRERARQLAVLFRDRPRPPLEEAIYWLEYVLRHRGAPHLRSAALDLSWHQHLLLDVAALMVGAAAAALGLLCLLLRRAASLLPRASTGAPKQKAS
ncbi:UDP-glycosyltransferase UGT5-like [Schistocerca serialis cubense]|uniref:UDP-glycosyltransferase UGT5-like n=1 Tax=Schistocerca serialis cubense TaxID=2023355 RepID=UPI00214E09B6|nr:UDP-glycosyltransferase UGT5-like [Schistocerca serialis cubense]XP_049964019.1 UDP-glycosyltransferase UGT5-like [Schistocerca serialis cubense]XP_049964020.1 UDP-glycosyltransferase UGT5-like [Schistocerca serialis cubense]